MTTMSQPTNNPENTAAVTRLVARERVRAMESLAGAIAHELRAAVLGVSSAAQLLRYSVPQDPIAEKSLGRILQESERLSALHEALTEYATEVPPRLTEDDPDAVWESAIQGLRGALEASSILLTHRRSPTGARCLLDRDQMIRAFERVVHHAIDRVPAGSEIAIDSAVDGSVWTSRISVVGPIDASDAGDYERPAFLVTLANRTLVAHGGEAADLHEDDRSRLAVVRLPVVTQS